MLSLLRNALCSEEPAVVSLGTVKTAPVVCLPLHSARTEPLLYFQQKWELWEEFFFMCEWRYWTRFHRWRPYKVNLKLQLGLSCIWMCELESAGLSSASLFPQLPTFGLCHEPISDSQIGPFQMKLNWKMLSRSTPKAAKGQPVALNEW